MGKIRYRNPDTYESTGSFKLGHAWQRHEPGGDIRLYQSPRAHSQSDFRLFAFEGVGVVGGVGRVVAG